MEMDREIQEIWKAGLDEHNKIRRIYQVPDLVGDPTLHADAWKHAHFLATTNSFLPATMGRYGTMISVSFKEHKVDAVRDAVRKWIDNKNCYDFCNEDVSKMGIGVAKSYFGNKYVVVGFYDNPNIETKLN